MRIKDFARLGSVLVMCVAAALSVGASSAGAATIVVNTSADENNSDGDCSLREAVIAAVVNFAIDACPAGQPDPQVDRITFGVTGSIAIIGPLSIYVPFGSLSIEGPGAELLTISGGDTDRPLLVGIRGMCG